MATESAARNEPSAPPSLPPPCVVIVVNSFEKQLSAVDGGGGKGGRADVADDLEVGGEFDEEKACRICHVSPDRTAAAGAELIQLGCGCKNELGTAHRHCAETWFRMKGNRCCEICGVNAKNITGEEDGSFIEEWHESRMPNNSSYRNTSERVGCWRGQPFCNFLMACLVIAFILPWFFRVNMF